MSPKTQVGHCKMDSTDVYAGRGRGGKHMLSVDQPGERGWLGNPFTLEDYSREESIQKFEEAFTEKLDQDEHFRNGVRALHGVTLGCWCQELEEDEPACHAEVIAQHADRLAKDGE